MKASKSANLHISGNNFFRFKPVGVFMETVRNITFDSNVIADVTERVVSG